MDDGGTIVVVGLDPLRDAHDELLTPPQDPLGELALEALEEERPTHVEGVADGEDLRIVEAGHPGERRQLRMLEPCGVMARQQIDRPLGLIQRCSGDVIARHRGRQILEHQTRRLEDVDQRGGNPDVQLRRDVTVEAVLALPHPHHLADEAAARIAGGQLHDHRRRHRRVRGVQCDTGQLAHEPVAGADRFDVDAVERNAQRLGHPFDGDVRQRLRSRHGTTTWVAAPALRAVQRNVATPALRAVQRSAATQHRTSAVVGIGIASSRRSLFSAVPGVSRRRWR